MTQNNKQSGFMVFIKILFGCVIIAIISVIGLAIGFSVLLAPSSQMPQETIFTIQKGESGQSVAKRLESDKLIKSSLTFDVLLRLPFASSGLKAGSYKITQGMSSQEIFALLLDGKQELIFVTVPEGYTLKQIALEFEKAKITKKDDFIAACFSKELLSSFSITNASAEGYLFPDTYAFQIDFPAESVVKTLISRYFEVLTSLAPESKTYTAKENYDRLIMASIIEREYRDPSEASKISGVFYNRIKKGMPLQSCATVVYIITDIQNKSHPSRLFFSDTEMENPYNTYINEGLPPGPISNPGKTALAAAYRPLVTDYLYFRLIDEQAGKHHFSITFDEHLQAGNLFVKSN